MNMKTDVQRSANSLAVRTPRSVAQETRRESSKEGDPPSKSATPAVSHARMNRYTLDALLAHVQEANFHSEANWGKPTGGEVW